MYQTRQVPRFQYGFPQYSMPMQRTSYNQPGGSVTTGPGQPQPSPLQQYAPTIGNQLAKRGLNYANDQADKSAYDAAIKNQFGLNDPDPRLISNTDAAQFGNELGGNYPGYYSGPEGTAASNTALDAQSPYAAGNLQNGGLLADTGAPAAPAADAAATTTAGSTVGTGAAGAADAGAAGSGAAAGGTAADAGLLGDAGSSLLGADLAGTGAADAGLLGTGAAAGGEAAGAAAAGEGTAAAVGATNFWNPVGWAALAGLAAYQMGLFD
jgi:hypothetical protein